MQVILSIAIVVSLIWGGIFLARGGLLAGMVAVLITASCFSSEFFEIRVKPMPITLDRILWAVLIVQYILWQRFGKADPKRFALVDGVLFGFVAWLMVGCVTHSGEVSPLPRLFFSYLMPLGLYWVARQAHITERAYKVSLVVFAVFGTYLAVTAVGEVAGIGWLIYPRYILGSPYGEFFGRARGPYLNPVANGMAICLAMLSAVCLWKEIPRRWRPVLVGLLLFYLVAIELTQTRCVWIGGIAALAVLLMAKVPREKRLPVAVYCFLLGSVLLASQWQRLVSFKRDKDLTAAETADSVKLRPILAAVAWKMFKDHPIDGVGLAQYDERSYHYLKKLEFGLPLERARGYTQHNVFLSLLTETGLVGMALFTVVLVLWSHGSLKLYGDTARPDWMRRQGLFFLAFMAAYLPNGMFHDVSQIAIINMLLFFEAGLTMNFLLRPTPEPTKNAGYYSPGGIK